MKLCKIKICLGCLNMVSIGVGVITWIETVVNMVGDVSVNRVLIQNFGPIGETEINLDKRFQILIGEQASGKSTISRVVYFCQKIRDYTLEFLLDSRQFTDNHENEYFNNYMKYLQGCFIGCFGTTKHMKKFTIMYMFDKHNITITLNDNGYVRYNFDSELYKGVKKLIYDAEGFYIDDGREKEYLSLIDRLTAMEMMRRQFEQELKVLFCNISEIIYIPAGRSLLATLSEQLHDMSISGIDLTMQEFIKLILRTKRRFGSKITDMAQDYIMTVRGQINNAAVEKAFFLIKNILKADYVNEGDGEKIYFDDSHWVKLMYGSSGQQEVLWILMLAFVTILENKNSFFVIEEPEAHLFPDAQKDIVTLISLMINVTGSRAIITTHSPYILTSANVLLYSDKVEKENKIKSVVSKNMRIAYNGFAAYSVGCSDKKEKTMRSIVDKTSHMIELNYIDRISSITNQELDTLLDMEINNDM